MTSEKLERMESFIIGAKGNINHTRRVLRISRLLAEKEGITYNEDILAFATYFHDIAGYPPYAPAGIFDHALESSLLVPGMAADFGYSPAEIAIIVEAVKFHDKAGMGTHAETRIIRNADGIDYLGYMAVARDLQKHSADMRKAIDTLRKRNAMFGPLIDLKYAIELAAPRIRELDGFVERFEEESFGIY